MALDTTHPAIIEHDGALGVITIPKAEALEAIERHREWQSASAMLERTRSRPLLVGGLLGTAAAIALGVFVWRLAGIEKYVLVVPVGFFVGAGIASVVYRMFGRPRASALAYVAPPPIQVIASEVIEHAPADASANDIIRWTQCIFAYQNAIRSIADARASVARKDYESYISPGDRSTWYYDPAGLTYLESQLEEQREAYIKVATELGFSE